MTRSSSTVQEGTRLLSLRKPRPPPQPRPPPRPARRGLGADPLSSWSSLKGSAAPSWPRPACCGRRRASRSPSRSLSGLSSGRMAGEGSREGRPLEPAGSAVASSPLLLPPKTACRSFAVAATCALKASSWRSTFVSCCGSADASGCSPTEAARKPTPRWASGASPALPLAAAVAATPSPAATFLWTGLGKGEQKLPAAPACGSHTGRVRVCLTA
mmetsp:Transcript_15562/g.44690  ORF Transcript_15562/g.44690 Transcript_15562/m.44690 type:complete len:215 (+) Transcript_15562:117-761(+)